MVRKKDYAIRFCRMLGKGSRSVSLFSGVHISGSRCKEAVRISNRDFHILLIAVLRLRWENNDLP